MKRINLFWGLVIPLLSVSCYDDLGNYDYKEINEIEVDSIRAIYSCDTDDSLSIFPIIRGTLYNDTSRFSYEWEIGSKKVATTHDLQIVVDMLPGHKYSRYIVKDKSTGVKKYYEFSVNVSSSTAGDLLMVLSKYQGRAELSYLRLDKEANWAINYYQDRYEEILGTNPQELAFRYIEQSQYDLYPFANAYGKMMVLADNKIRLIDKSTLMPDTITPYLTGEAYTTLASYPKPEITGYKSEFMTETVYIWRLVAYGWQKWTYFMEISGGKLYTASQASAVWASSYTFQNPSPYKGYLAPFGYWDDMSNTPNDNNTQMGYKPGDFIVFDQIHHRFAFASAYGITEIKEADLKPFPDYDNLLWGSATNISNTTSIAVLNNGDQCRLVLLQAGVDANNKATKKLSSEISAGNVIHSKSRFYMMKYNDYLLFTTGDKLYRYNLLNVSSGITPGEKDLVLKLSDYGYDATATITDLCVSRSEKTLLLGISRYGGDTEGSGEEAKGDILYFDLDATTLQLTHRPEKSHQGISGIPVNVEIKYQTFWRDGKNEKGVAVDNI